MNHMPTTGNVSQPPEITGYQLLEPLGWGELMPCWKAIQRASSREVLIRLLPSSLTPVTAVLERMRATANRMIALNSPSIVKVYDFGLCITSRRYFMATELFSIDSILEWTQDDQCLSETNALLVAQCAAEALAYAWDQAHMIHANLKPKKFLVDADNILKLDEIGLAEILAAGWENSSRGVITGTPRYMSPERSIKKRTPDISDDIYALGLTLYQLVTGIVPVLYNADRDEWQIPPQLYNPRDVNPALSKSMGILIQKMTEINSERRHQSWKEVLKDIASMPGHKAVLLSDPDITQPIILEKRSSADTVRIALRRTLLKKNAGIATSAANAPQPDPKNVRISRQCIWKRALNYAVLVGALLLLSFYGYMKLTHQVNIFVPARIKIAKALTPIYYHWEKMGQRIEKLCRLPEPPEAVDAKSSPPVSAIPVATENPTNITHLPKNSETLKDSPAITDSVATAQPVVVPSAPPTKDERKAGGNVVQLLVPAALVSAETGQEVRVSEIPPPEEINTNAPVNDPATTPLNPLADTNTAVTVSAESGESQPATSETAVASQPDPAEAFFQQGLRYAENKQDVEELAKAASHFQMAADLGLAKAQYELARCYQEGRGVLQDRKESVKWFLKAAKQNYVKAQHDLAECYASGAGVPSNPTEAIKWHRHAADAGYAPAQVKIAEWYAEGKGISQNKREACRWYQRAAEQEEPEAQYQLGLAYANGIGVIKNQLEAVKWLERAVCASHPSAKTLWLEQLNELGKCYLKGIGVQQDPAKAAECFQKAALHDSAEAQYQLGLCYEQGKGVEKDVHEASNWMIKAALQGVAPAKAWLKQSAVKTAE